MTHEIFRQSRTPLYLQLAEVIRQDIDSGRWGEGALLPTVDHLAEDFKVAKITVRQAIKLLEEEGRVLPRRGYGTTILPKQPRRRPLSVSTNLQDLIAMYSGDVPELVALDDRTSDLPNGVEDLPAYPEYHMLRRMHARDGQRYCVITIYIARPVFEKYETRFRKELALPVLNDAPDVTVTSARQSLKVAKCDMTTAGLLDLPIGEPVAEVRRIIRDQSGQVLYLADVIYRGDYIRLEMDLLA